MEKTRSAETRTRRPSTIGPMTMPALSLGAGCSYASLVAVFACETKPLTLNASVSIMTPARIA